MTTEYKKGTKKGTGRTQKLVGFYIDDDLIDFIKQFPNKSRLANMLIRKYKEEYFGGNN